jgi:RNA polymerase sigma-70 factor (ECF subfamily)
MKQFLLDQRRRDLALKRGGGKVFVAMDVEQVERKLATATAASDPAQEYDRQWAQTVVARVLDRMGSEASRNRRQAEFECLRGFLTDGPARGAYAEAARELGMTDGAVKVAVHRMRRRFGKILREEIGATVSAADQVDSEIRHLFEALGR